MSNGDETTNVALLKAKIEEEFQALQAEALKLSEQRSSLDQKLAQIRQRQVQLQGKIELLTQLSGDKTDKADKPEKAKGKK